MHTFFYFSPGAHRAQHRSRWVVVVAVAAAAAERSFDCRSNATPNTHTHTANPCLFDVWTSLVAYGKKRRQNCLLLQSLVFALLQWWDCIKRSNRYKTARTNNQNGQMYAIKCVSWILFMWLHRGASCVSALPSTAQQMIFSSVFDDWI